MESVEDVRVCQSNRTVLVRAEHEQNPNWKCKILKASDWNGLNQTLPRVLKPNGLRRLIQVNRVDSAHGPNGLKLGRPMDSGNPIFFKGWTQQAQAESLNQEFPVSLPSYSNRSIVMWAPTMSSVPRSWGPWSCYVTIHIGMCYGFSYVSISQHTTT